jgi:serine/threonine protein kinase
MYHELRELLRTPPHPNITARPRYLVTRHVVDTGEQAVYGFVLTYHRGENLLEALQTGGKPLRQTQMKWMRQILSALRHIHAREGAYYSDLRPDNIVLSDGGDAVLADFEQHGSTERWLHPKLWRARHAPTPSQASATGRRLVSTRPICLVGSATRTRRTATGNASPARPTVAGRNMKPTRLLRSCGASSRVGRTSIAC